MCVYTYTIFPISLLEIMGLTTSGRRPINSLCYWPFASKISSGFVKLAFPVPLNTSCLKKYFEKRIVQGFPFCLWRPWLCSEENLMQITSGKKSASKDYLMKHMSSDLLSDSHFSPSFLSVNAELYLLWMVALCVFRRRPKAILDFCWRLIADVITWKIYWHFGLRKSQDFVSDNLVLDSP